MNHIFRFVLALVLIIMLIGCSNSTNNSDHEIRCGNKEEAFEIAQLYMAGRHDKLPKIGGLYATYTSQDTQVEYLGECAHRVFSVITENNESKRPILMTFEAIVINDYGTENWKLKQLQVKNKSGEILINENNDF